MPSKLEMKRQWLPIRILPIMTSCWLRPHHDIICGDFVMRSKSKFGQMEWVSSADGCVFRGKSGVIEAARRWDKKIQKGHIPPFEWFQFHDFDKGDMRCSASMRKLQKGCIGKRVTVCRGICHGQDMLYGLWSSISYKSPMDWSQIPIFWPIPSVSVHEATALANMVLPVPGAKTGSGHPWESHENPIVSPGCFTLK